SVLSGWAPQRRWGCPGRGRDPPGASARPPAGVPRSPPPLPAPLRMVLLPAVAVNVFAPDGRTMESPTVSLTPLLLLMPPLRVKPLLGPAGVMTNDEGPLKVIPAIVNPLPVVRLSVNAVPCEPAVPKVSES